MALDYVPVYSPDGSIIYYVAVDQTTDGTHGVQVNKMATGALDADPVLVSNANPMPAYRSGGVYYDENGNRLTVKHENCSVASNATDVELVAAVTAKKIRVLWVLWLGGNAVTKIRFNSKPGSAGTAISADFENDAYSGVEAESDDGLFSDTASGEGLSVSQLTASTVIVTVQCNYVEIP